MVFVYIVLHMRSSKTPIVTPVHKSEASRSEILRLKISLSNNPKVDHYFVIPQSLNTTSLEKNFPDSKFIKFEDSNFESIQSYNLLLLSRKFYEAFEEFENILICQLDAILIDDIQKISKTNRVYTGAPWINPYLVFSMRSVVVVKSSSLFRFLPGKISVGNGGLSFRNIRSFINILDQSQNDRVWNFFKSGKTGEDLVFSYLFKKYNYKITSRKQSSKIFVETSAKKLDSVPKVIGFHALDKFNPDLELLVFKTYQNL